MALGALIRSEGTKTSTSVHGRVGLDAPFYSPALGDGGRSHRTDHRGDTARCDGDSRQQFRHQRPEISKAIGPGPQHNDSDRKRLQVLLERQVAIHRYKHIETLRDQRQQPAVRNAGPPLVPCRLYLVA